MADGAQIHRPKRYQSADFESFERFVLNWLPKRNLDSEDYVFHPQRHSLLTSKGEIGVHHLGRIEDACSYHPFIEDTLGPKIKIRVINHSTKTFSYRKAYTKEIRDTLARCYAENIERFDYNF